MISAKQKKETGSAYQCSTKKLQTDFES